MQIDLRTVSITPQRNTFDHLVRRFGDKPASRYQEGSYDLQADANFQYRPSWDPERALHDPSRTQVVMSDWYVLKDPRQYYYGAWALARSRQQEASEASFEFVGSRALLQLLSDEDRTLAVETLMPLRHLAWAANLNNSGICADGYGTLITQACMFQSMDNLGIAQYLTRLGLLLDHTDALATGRARWMDHPHWQPLRALAENSLVQRDWFELLVAQNLVLDGLLYPLVYEQFVDTHLKARNGAGVAMCCAFMSEWFSETSRWMDAVIKAVCKESAANQQRVSGWTVAWRDRAIDALRPVAGHAFKDEADGVMASVIDTFNARADKLGLSV